MRKVFFYTVFAAVWTLTLNAHADTIDDFVLTGAGHTITYSLPATTSTPDFDIFNYYYEAAPGVIDGVSGYSVISAYYIIFPGYDMVLYNLPSSIFGDSTLRFGGPTLFSYVTVPAQNPPPYFQDDIVATFIPGVYTLRNIPNVTVPPSLPAPPPQPVLYTLTITPETAVAATPEPSTLILFATGAFGLLALAKSAARRNKFIRRGV